MAKEKPHLTVVPRRKGGVMVKIGTKMKRFPSKAAAKRGQQLADMFEHANFKK